MVLPSVVERQKSDSCHCKKGPHFSGVTYPLCLYGAWPTKWHKTTKTTVNVNYSNENFSFLERKQCNAYLSDSTQKKSEKLLLDS